MIRIFVAIFMALTLISCNLTSKSKKRSNDRGMIIPKKSKRFSPKRPIGMVPIPSGSFVMGQTDLDFTDQQNATPKTVSVSGFFMDDTEISNSEYQDFVTYVKDSIVRQKLAERAYQLGFDGSNQDAEEGIAEYAFKGYVNEDGEQSAYQQYISEMADGRSGYESERQLNWDVPIIWEKNEYPDRDYVEVMESMYYPPEERFNGERLIDVRNLNYVFTEIDKNKAAKAKMNESKKRSDFVTTYTVNVYPDTTVWVRDFNYAYNDPLHEDYFWNEAYADYPVVGVTWDQARAFCAYRTAKHRNYNASKRKIKDDVITYRLPTEVEWEYAARGGLQDAPYPWGGPYLTDSRGCYLANFKPKRGDYVEDCCAKSKKTGYIYTAPVKSFYPNDYGLFDMSGNVAEWTQSPYNTSSNEYTSTLNPYIDSGRDNKFKTVKGGSWKDVGFMLMIGARDYENKDSARSYIGFRTVQSIPEGAKVKYKRTRQ